MLKAGLAVDRKNVLFVYTIFKVADDQGKYGAEARWQFYKTLFIDNCWKSLEKVQLVGVKKIHLSILNTQKWYQFFQIKLKNRTLRCSYLPPFTLFNEYFLLKTNSY